MEKLIRLQETITRRNVQEVGTAMHRPLSRYAAKLLVITLRQMGVHRTPEQIDEWGLDIATDIVVKYCNDPTFRVKEFRAYIIQMIRNQVNNRKRVKRERNETDPPEFFEPVYHQDFSGVLIEEEVVSIVTEIVNAGTEDPEIVEAVTVCVGRGKDYHSMMYRLPAAKRWEFEALMEDVRDALINYCRG